MMNKNSLAIVSIVIIGILLIIGIFISVNGGKHQDFTGGSGEPERGYLVLTGYETKSNDEAKISLGTFLTTTQQRKIRSFLEVQLFNQKDLDEYSGKVVPGTVEVDYVTNIITFKVEIDDPKSIYTVNFNTLTDEMMVLDEKGQLVDPSGS